MAPRVLGGLREEATKGEKLVFDLLKAQLPNDFTLYVETPIYLPRKNSNPDFIVLTNYGFVVLEVKDWSNFSANKYGVRLPNGKTYTNPVTQARGYALDLSNAIDALANKNNLVSPNIPYGYAVVFPYFPSYSKDQIRAVWGDFVILQSDLKLHLLSSLRNTVRKEKIHPLTKSEMDLIRGAINPEITFQDGVILDETQSQLVFEVPTDFAGQKPKKSSEIVNNPLFADVTNGKYRTTSDLPLESQRLVYGNTFRLIRGVMGSGKTLVLIAKAKHFAIKNPDWSILVLSYNNELAQGLKSELRQYKNIRATNLDQLLYDTINKENKFLWRPPSPTSGWVENHKGKFPIIASLGTDFITDELTWIQEVMVSSRQDYLEIRRVGRGTQIQINKDQRNEIYTLLEKHLKDLDKHRQLTWESLYPSFVNMVKKHEIMPPLFDAILIDEAQDFAPSWIAVVNRLMKPQGTLFMVDDPSQSIFRYFSWKQRGVDVVGRTKYLKEPYRNTKEIYYAAQSMINNDEELIGQLKSEGEVLLGDIDLNTIRSGERPAIVSIAEAGNDLRFVESQIQSYKREKGVKYESMCVIAPNAKEAKRFTAALSKYNIKIITRNRVKGLTFDIVFIVGLENYFSFDPETNSSRLSQEKRIIYSSMGRARNSLYLLHQKKISPHFEVLRDYVDYFDYK